MKRKVILLSLLSLLLVGCTETNSIPNGSTPSTPSSNTASRPSIQHFLDVLTSEDGLAFAGTLTIDNGTESQVTNLQGFFSDDEYYLNDEAYGSAEHYYRGTGEYEGKLVGKDLLPDNTLDEFVYINELEQPIDFSEYTNPLAKLQPSNFKAEDNLYKAVIPTNLRTTFGLVFTGYSNLTFDEFSFLYDDTNITSLSLNGEVGTTTFELVFTLSTKEKINVPVIEVRPHEAAHDLLQEAFDKLALGNYTITYVDVDPTGEYPTMNYQVKVDDNALYMKNLGGGSDEVPTGYVQLESGLVPVKFNDETHVAKGTALPDSSRKLTDLKSKFDIAPELFTIDKDGKTFRVTPGLGMDNYYDMFFVDKILDGSNFQLSDFSTYSFTVNDNDTYTVKYSYEILGYSGDVTITVSNVGTTDVGYTESDYEEKDPDQNSWADLNVEGLDAYLTSKVGSPDNLPYPNSIEGLRVDDIDDPALLEYYNTINISYDSSVYADLATAMAKYEEALVAAGWVNIGTTEYKDEIYTLTTKSAVYKITLYATTASYFQINFYDPEAVSTANPLSEFISANFSKSINASFTTEQDIETYQASEEDITANTHGNLINAQHTTTKAMFTDTEMYSEITDLSATEISYVKEEDGTITTYNKEDGTWDQGTIAMGTIKEVYYTVADLINTANYIIPVRDNIYTIEENTAIDAFVNFFFGLRFSNYTGAEVELTFDESTNVLTFDLYFEGYFKGESEGSYVYRIYDLSATLNNVGTTVITDKPSLN